MKQHISAREFDRRRKEITEALKPGQAITVTVHGKPVARFEKLAQPTVKRPNFLTRVTRHTYPTTVGDRLIEQLYESVS